MDKQMKHNKKRQTVKIYMCKDTVKQDKRAENAKDKWKRKTKELKANDDVQKKSYSKN